MPNPSMHVRLLQPAETRALRHLVLWPHIKDESDCVLAIDEAAGTMHFGVVVNGMIASVGTIYPELSPKVKASRPFRLRAMATHPDYRRKHLGENLLKHAFIELTQLGGDVLWCDARIAAVPFYTSLGFQIHSEIYDVPNIGPHQFMWKELR